MFAVGRVVGFDEHSLAVGRMRGQRQCFFVFSLSVVRGVGDVAVVCVAERRVGHREIRITRHCRLVKSYGLGVLSLVPEQRALRKLLQRGQRCRSDLRQALISQLNVVEGFAKRFASFFGQHV